ncbi:MAG TPA: alpha-L-fucosidase, partial [Puia sp.]
MKRTSCLLLVFFSVVFVQAQSAARGLSKDERLRWWKEAKFGMFIHWGISSVWAGRYQGKEIPGHSEWIMHGAKIPVAEYRRLAGRFRPTAFNAEQWVRIARDAGMKYIVFTCKHHDGFAMFGSGVSKLNVVDATPFKRDIVRELAAACRKYGVRLGLYYSQAQDWLHPGGAASGGSWDPAQKGDMNAYLDTVGVPQVRELLTKYGPIAEFWWDTPNDMDAEKARKFLPLLALQPEMITNNRLGGGVPGDIETPEQYIPATGIPGRNWESCMTMNDSWGYKARDSNWKSSKTLIRSLVDITSKGGNLLLNVGPMADGRIPTPSIVRLKEMGGWLARNGEAIYGTAVSPFPYLPWGRATRKEGKLYLHVFEWPRDGVLRGPLLNKVRRAYLLATPGKELRTFVDSGFVMVRVPVECPDTAATVVVLDIEGKVKVNEDIPGKVAFSSLFTDNMVLQQRQVTTIRGT